MGDMVFEELIPKELEVFVNGSEGLMGSGFSVSTSRGSGAEEFLTPDRRRSLDRLTPRERQVLREIGAGEGNRALARRMGIAERTVKAHLTSIMRKLDLRSRVEAALLSREWGAEL